MKEGDAPTCFFHAHANACRQKNFIHSVTHEGNVLVSEESKAQAFFSFYDKLLGTSTSCSCNINLDVLDLPRLSLASLGEHFTEEEIWVVIRVMPADKAPGLDGYTMRFLQAARSMIRADVMVMFDVL
jgi:hypothetical protein